jgi:hypothetical protein
MADAERPGAGQHEHRGQRAVMRLVEFAPASGSLALWVQHQDVSADEAKAHSAGLLPAYTDGLVIHYTPAFERLPLAEQTGWVAHQVLHIALRHAQRFRALQRRLGDVDLALFNRCADAIVNSTLAEVDWIALPRNALTLPVLLDQVVEITRSADAALAEWDVERLYGAVDDREARANDRGDPRRDGPRAATLRALGGSANDDLKPAPQGPDAVVAEAEQTREWGDRLLRGHSGDGAMSMLRTLPADVPRVHTPWEQVLRTVVARALAPGLVENPSRPSRSWLANQGRVGRPHKTGRLPWASGLTHTRRHASLVLVLDVSGSIDAPLLDRFAAELRALTRRLDAPLTLVLGDDRVRAVQRVAPGRLSRTQLSALSTPGAGGTDFTPLLEEASRHRPDLVVVLTDLDGPAHHRPRCPVLWAVPPHAGTAPAAPFGRVLALR